MGKMTTAIRLMKKSRNAFFAAILENLNFIFADKLYLQLMFRCKMGCKLNLNNPQTFNEKLQWLKLYNRDPLYTILVDKYSVKKWVAEKIGCENIIPTLGVWDSPNDIDFDNLPNQFVLKTTNGGGGDIVVCRDKSKFDRTNAVKHLNYSLKKNIYKKSREWPYKNVPPRVIAEKYMEDESGELRDYKFFCFNGSVKALFIATDRQKQNVDTKFDFYDRNFNHLPFTKGHPNADVAPQKPMCFERMINLAEILSANIPHVRVDFYEVYGKVYFGEMTFFDNAGMVAFNPSVYDKIWGEWLNLPERWGD